MSIMLESSCMFCSIRNAWQLVQPAWALTDRQSCIFAVEESCPAKCVQYSTVSSVEVKECSAHRFDLFFGSLQQTAQQANEYELTDQGNCDENQTLFGQRGKNVSSHRPYQQRAGSICLHTLPITMLCQSLRVL